MRNDTQQIINRVDACTQCYYYNLFSVVIDDMRGFYHNSITCKHYFQFHLMHSSSHELRSHIICRFAKSKSLCELKRCNNVSVCADYVWRHGHENHKLRST